jgi:hypothetical protein
MRPDIEDQVACVDESPQQRYLVSRMRAECCNLFRRKVAFECRYRPKDAVDDDRFGRDWIGLFPAEQTAEPAGP